MPEASRNTEIFWLGKRIEPILCIHSRALRRDNKAHSTITLYRLRTYRLLIPYMIADSSGPLQKPTSLIIQYPTVVFEISLTPNSFDLIPGK
jgi:hypothetical protein